MTAAAAVDARKRSAAGILPNATIARLAWQTTAARDTTHTMTEAQTLTITTLDQHRFDATLHLADDPGSPVLIFLSALGTPSRVYGRFGREMAMHGVQLCTPDWRGIGSSSIRAGRRGDFGYRHLIEFDLASLIEAVRQRLPEAPIWLGGHSLGGQLALLRAAASPDAISGVALIASGSVHLPCYSGRLRMGVRSLVYVSRAVSPLLGYFPGSRIGFGGREAAGLMRDWSHVAVTGEYRPSGSDVDYEKALSSLKIPILALTFAADAWSPALAAESLLKKLPKNSAIHWHWNSSDTAGLAVDHYSWIKQPVLVAPAVARFIRQLHQH
jgi:predicted alpha/beta hydrolase